MGGRPGRGPRAPPRQIHDSIPATINVTLGGNRQLSRLAIAAATLWVLLVTIGLVTTLQSLSDDGFDGLNNMLQVLFALPWWLVVPAPWSHTVDAWVTAGLGVVNAGLVFVLVSRWDAQRGETP